MLQTIHKCSDHTKQQGAWGSRS
jgi:hypothetical protein